MTEKKPDIAIPITYGAIISITHPFDEDLGICSEGMIKSDIYLEGFEQAGSKNPFFKSLFQIYPSFINTYKNDALRMKEELQSDLTKAHQQKKTLDILKEKLTLEYKFNLEYFEKLKNTPISFGQAIQFLHLASNRFLCCNFQESAEIEKENYKLELVEISSKSTNFKILPSYKHQKESEGNIYYGDLVFITHFSNFLNKVPYIHCYIEEQTVIKSTSLQNSKIGSPSKNPNKKEVNISLEKNTRWKFNQFSQVKDNDSYLSYGDIIWVHHVDHNATLIVQQVFTKNLGIGFTSITTNDRFQRYIGNTNGMWIIENEDYKIGGFVQYDQKFRLKHFVSGKYLTVDFDSQKNHHKLELTIAKNPSGLFEFVSSDANIPKNLDSSQGYIKKDAFVRIRNQNYGLWLNVGKKDEKVTAKLSIIPSKDDLFKLLLANFDEVCVTSFLLSCHPILKSYLFFLEGSLPKSITIDSFIDLKRVQKKMKAAQACLIQLELFCINKLLDISPDQKYGEINSFRQKVLREQHFLELLAQILKSSFSPEEYEQHLRAKLIGKKIQEEKNIIIASKIENNNKNKSIPHSFILEEKIKVCKLIYRLIATICKNNPENELHTFKLIQQFQYHVAYFEEAVDCFIQIISKNETLLNKIGESIDTMAIEKGMTISTLKESNINKYVEAFTKQASSHRKKKMETKSGDLLLYFLELIKNTPPTMRNRNYLRFLRSICTCNGKSVKTNQELLFKIFSTNEQLKANTFLQTKLNENGQLYIGLTNFNMFSLRNCFHDQGKLCYNELEIEYFQEQLGFASDLLLGRNYLWRQVFRDFPMSFLFDHIYNKELSLEIRAAFCDLAFSLYIDHEPLNPRVVPNLCRVFEDSTSNKEFVKQFSINPKLRKKENFDFTSLSNLVDNIIQIIHEEQVKIENELVQAFSVRNRKNMSQIKLAGLMENNLLVKVVKLLSNLIKFNMITILEKKALYPQIVYDLIRLLEYDNKAPWLSYSLMKRRIDENLLQDEEKSKKKLARSNKLQNMANLVGNLSKNILLAMKDVAFNIFDGSVKKMSKSSGNVFLETDDPNFLNNPLTKGLIQLNHQLDQLLNEDKSNNTSNEVAIKEEICDLFIYILDLRQDFLISNVLSWFINVMNRVKSHAENEATTFTENAINEEIHTVLPEIPKTGLRAIDKEFKKKPQIDVLDKMPKIMRTKISEIKPKFDNFVNYTDEEPIADLDTLFIKAQNQNNDFVIGVLPSLLMAFYSTRDVNLKSKLLTVIMRLFNQKAELSINLRNLEVIFAKKDIGTYQLMEQWFTDLRIMTEKLEIWLSDYIQDGDEEELNKAFDILKKIHETMSGLDNQEPKTLKMRQSVMRNLKGYVTLIHIIRNGIHHVKYISKECVSYKGKEPRLLKLFSLTYDCLFHFCKGNEANQWILSENFKLFLSHLEMDIKQIPVICEICRIPKLIYEKYDNFLTESLLRAIAKFGRKAAFLEPFLILQEDEGLSVDVQIKIMSQLLPSYKLLQDKEIKVLYAEQDEHSKKINFVFEKVLPMDEPYEYHSKLFEIFLFSAKQNKGLEFLFAKLRKLVDIPNFIELLLEPDNWNPGQIERDIFIKDRNTVVREKGFSKIKTKVLELVDMLFVKVEEEPGEITQKCQSLIADFIRSERVRLEGIPKNSRLMDELNFYLFDKLVPFLDAYVNRIILVNKEGEEERVDSQALGEYAQSLFDKFSSIIPPGASRQRQVCKSFLSHYYDETDLRNQIDANRTLLEINLPDWARGDIRKKTELVPNKPSVSGTDFRINDGETDLWDSFVNKFLRSETLADEISKEKVALSKTILSFQDMLPDEYKNSLEINIGSNELIRKFISFLESGLTNQVNKVTMISTLDILANIIDTAENKIEMQNLFDQNGATTMLLSLLSDSEHGMLEDDLLNQLLIFGISLLDGGNHNVQKTIFNFCKFYQKSEVMFATFNLIIYKQINFLQIKNTIKQDQPKFFDLDDQSKNATLVERILRFLQLLTEGHYQDMQNYLRYQTNSRTKYNMVEAITELLKTYYSDLVESNYENIVKCLDTLTEFVQGPCLENQIDLIDGKFFEVAVGILALDQKNLKKEVGINLWKVNKKTAGSRIFTTSLGPKKNIEAQNKPLSSWMVARLKYKVLVLITSLLEMRSSDAVVKKIMRSLPLEVLKTNLIKVYKSYKKMYGTNYGMESLKHYNVIKFDGDPITEEKREGYYDLITENGFMSYFLISNFLESSKDLNDISILNEIQEDYNALPKKKKKKSWLTNNPLTEFTRFTYIFLVAFFGYFWKGIFFFQLFKDDKTIELKSLLAKRIRRQRINTKKDFKEKDDQKIIKKAQNEKQDFKSAMKFFSMHSASIEISRGDNLEKVQFILMPYCHLLPKETKERFHDKVNRQSPKTKVSDLVQKSENLIDVCKYELSLKLFFDKYRFISLITSFITLWQDLCFFLSIALNIIILVPFSIYFSNNKEVDRKDVGSESIQDNVITILGITVATCSLFVVLFSISKNSLFTVRKALKKVQSKKEPSGSIFWKVKLGFWTVFYSLMNFEILYYLSYGTLSVFGTLGYPLLFAFHLSQILIRAPTLKNVIMSVWKPRKQLGLTFLLYLIINYIFSLFAFVFFDEDYNKGCESTILCFLNTFDFTFKANGGIGGYLDELEKQLNPDADLPISYEAGRFIFDFLANIILVIIMINIVLGIIIDTFRSLREKERENEVDTREKCFVCGLSKSLFDKNSGNYSFDVHIRKDHYLWNYLFYIAYLHEKEKTEFTGIESFIYEKLKNKDTSWFPFYQTQALKLQLEDEDDEDREIKRFFYSQIDDLRKNIQDLNKISYRFAERLI